MAKKHALLLANTEYRDARLAPLSAPGQGYAELADALKDPARGAFTQVETLANANLSQILHALDRFFSRRAADDFMLVYISGHGFVDAQGEIFLSLRESDRYRLKSTALMAAVLGMNMDLCPSPHKALVLDCRFHALVTGTAPQPIQPDRVFAGRGLPKVIFSASDTLETLGKPAAPADRHAQEFTRVLAECLRPPAAAQAKKAPFTLKDWWGATLAAFQASGQANPPRLHAVGNPPETVLRGIPMPRAQMAMTAAPGPQESADSEAPEEMQWSRLSGIFPLEMIAPELAIPAADNPEGSGSAILERESAPSEDPEFGKAPEARTPPAAPAARRPEDETPFDLRLPPTLNGEPTLMWDRKQIKEAMKQASESEAKPQPPSAPRVEMPEPVELTPRDSFVDMRARLRDQEEEEKRARKEADEEEALQRRRLEQWKARWDSKLGKEADARAEDEAASEGRSTQWARLAELQKTVFFNNPDGDPYGFMAAEQQKEDEADRKAETKERGQDRGFPEADGRATIMVSKEEFLRTAPPAAAPAAKAPAAPVKPPPAQVTPVVPPAPPAPAARTAAPKPPAAPPAPPEEPTPREAEAPAMVTSALPQRPVPHDDETRIEAPPAPVEPETPKTLEMQAGVEDDPEPPAVFEPPPAPEPGLFDFGPRKTLFDEVWEKAPNPFRDLAVENLSPEQIKAGVSHVRSALEDTLRAPSAFRPSAERPPQPEAAETAQAAPPEKKSAAKPDRRRALRIPGRAPKRRADDASDMALKLELSDGKTSLVKRLSWIGIGFVPVFLLVLLYLATKSGMLSGSHAAPEAPSSAKNDASSPAVIVPEETSTLPPSDEVAPKPAAVKPPAVKAPATAAVHALPKPAAPALPRPETKAPETPVAAPSEPAAKAAAAKPKPSKARAPAADAAEASPQADSILATAVKEALSADANALRSIYDRFALGFPGLKGDLTIDLKIDPSGWILEGVIESSNTAVDLFDQEILRKALGWKLHSFPGEKPRSIAVPLHFPLGDTDKASQ